MHKFGILMFIFAVAACGGADGSTDTTVATVETTTTATDETTTTTTTPSTTTTSQPSGESSLAAPLEVGAVIQVGDWRLRVSGVTPDATDQVMAENQFNDPPVEGNQFFIASVEATYTGTDSSTFWVDMSLKAVGESHVAYEPFDATCGVIPGDINDTGETFPGGTVSGNVCWSIQTTDADSLVMIAEESFTFDETRAFLSLDPSAEPLDETTTVDGSGSDLGPTVSVGDPATVGSWEIRVVGVTPDATDQDMTLKAIGESNVAYEPYEASCGVIPDDINDAGETFPGGTVTGNVCWSVGSQDVTSLVLIAEESFTFDETRVFFALAE
jgi:hypothetical protein